MLTVFVYTLVMAFVVLKVLNAFVPMRSPREDEEAGLDVPETGTVAYPDFEIAHTL